MPGVWCHHAVMDTGGGRIRYHRRFIPRLLQTKCDGMLGAVWQREHTGKCKHTVTWQTMHETPAPDSYWLDLYQQTSQSCLLFHWLWVNEGGVKGSVGWFDVTFRSSKCISVNFTERFRGSVKPHEVQLWHLQLIYNWSRVERTSRHDYIYWTHNIWSCWMIYTLAVKRHVTLESNTSVRI